MNYSEFVQSRFKSGEKIAEEMTAHKIGLLTLQIDDVVQESDTLDKIKKYAIYNDDKHGCSSWGLPCSSSAFDGLEPTPSQCELLHAAIGIAGEAGELLDAVRKHVFDGQDLDVGNCIEEMGDLAFFFQAMLHALGVDRAYIEAMNQSKLSKRYKDGYSDRAAIERKDVKSDHQ